MTRGGSDDAGNASRRGPVGSGRVGEHPPGPTNVPILGAAPTVARDPLKRLLELVQDYGDVSYYRVGSVPLYVLGHPDDIAAVLVGEHHQYMKDEITHELSRFIGRGLVSSEGGYWRRQRRIAAPSFQRRHIERFAEAMVACTQSTVNDARPGPRDIHVDMMSLTLDIVLHTLFGDAEMPDHGEVAEIVTAALEEFQRVHLTWRRLLPGWIFTESQERMTWAREGLDRILFRIISERRRRGTEGKDLLGRLLAARDDDGSQMTDEQVRDEVATMFLAGHETTALALSYAILLLAHHPAAQRRLHAELDEVLGDRAARLQDVGALRYTDAVVREAMRLYPPVYTIGREALEDRTIAGYVVPRGSQVLLPQWAVHRDPRWFEEPEAFRPERWQGGLADRLPRFAYFPFGGGPRVCVGNHFAMLEGVLCLATFMQSYRARPDPTFELSFRPSVTLRPRHGVRVRLEPRTSSPAGA